MKKPYNWVFYHVNVVCYAGQSEGQKIGRNWLVAGYGKGRPTLSLVGNQSRINRQISGQN